MVLIPKDNLKQVSGPSSTRLFIVTFIYEFASIKNAVSDVGGPEQQTTLKRISGLKNKLAV